MKIQRRFPLNVRKSGVHSTKPFYKEPTKFDSPMERGTDMGHKKSRFVTIGIFRCFVDVFRPVCKRGHCRPNLYKCLQALPSLPCGYIDTSFSYKNTLITFIMFQIANVSTASGTHTYILVGGASGKEVVGPTGPLGPQGASYQLIFPGLGYLKLTDVGNSGTPTPWSHIQALNFSCSGRSWRLVCTVFNLFDQLVLPRRGTSQS